jgi:hypothetical protein
MRAKAYQDLRLGTLYMSVDMPPPEPAPKDLPLFAEPGARNERGEYVRWLYVCLAPYPHHGARLDASMRYPWPFASRRVDTELLVAHWHMHQFANWPKPWECFATDIAYCMKHENGRSLTWAIATYAGHDGVPTKLFDPIPTEILNALTRSD